ncbi:uncharacterized protein CPUR_04465 [Claviceps purpurea 20.1]|uniref:BTB domain-containing protein n=1 Tax=Claviceps purpurea (strain 20.1) TaxID=1111077 RepID=M1W156_CLAP2|nr:uncharacterized protein CPUR_04465 [Claviceps purpurea 20.1]
MAVVQKSRYDLDPQGDTILVLRRPNTNQPVWEPKDEVSKLKQKNDTRRRKFFGLDYMSETEDAHEPTPEPIAPAIESSVPNDGGEAHGDNSERNDVQFQLSSRHLALASPVFKTMLNGSWKESARSSDPSNGSAKTRAPVQNGPKWLNETSDVDGWQLSSRSKKSAKTRKPLKNGSDSSTRYELTATEWDDEVFLTLMNIIHGRNTLVPLSVDLITLVKMSVIVDYYQCQEVTQVVVGLWIDKLSDKLPTSYDRDCVIWMFVSWVFYRSEIFEKMTQLAVRTCDGGLGTINLPFPPILLTVMEQKRDHFIDEIFNILGDLCRDLCKGRRGCDFECTTMLLGSLLRGMDHNELYGACSAERAKSAVLSLRSGTWSYCDSHFSNYSRNSNYSSKHPHPCTIQALILPGIGKLWNGLDGLKLDDYNGQNKKFAKVPSSTLQH